MASLPLGPEARGADPARLGDVEHDPVRAAVLHLDVALMLAALADSQRLVDVIAAPRTGRAQLPGDGLQALDLKADVMDAGVVLASLDPGRRVILEVEDRQ